MKKVALVIFPIHSSHGCILQTYALKTKLEELGFIIDIIDRHRNLPSLRYRTIYLVKNIVKRILKGNKLPLLYPKTYRSFKMKNLMNFVNEYLQPQLFYFDNEKKLKSHDWSQYYALVVGSDQTWRPKYVTNVFNFYLDFAKEFTSPLKIAYAPSFGVDTWEYNDEQTLKAQELVKCFNAVSVREKSGVELCKNYLHKTAVSVLDPTLLFTGEDYIQKLKLNVTEKNLVAAYYLDKTVYKKDIVNNITKKFGCDYLYVNKDIENPKASKQEQIAPSIKDWLESCLSAKFVVVDSFHAMVFSILFHKQFIVVGNKERGLSRFQSLLDKIGLGDRLITDNEDPISLLSGKIDWQKVDQRLEHEREFSIDFLSKALLLH